jgi:hypothetical protein
MASSGPKSQGGGSPAYSFRGRSRSPRELTERWNVPTRINVFAVQIDLSDVASGATADHVRLHLYDVGAGTGVRRCCGSRCPELDRRAGTLDSAAVSCGRCGPRRPPPPCARRLARRAPWHSATSAGVGEDVHRERVYSDARGFEVADPIKDSARHRARDLTASRGGARRRASRAGSA